MTSSIKFESKEGRIEEGWSGDEKKDLTEEETQLNLFTLSSRRDTGSAEVSLQGYYQCDWS